MSEAKHAPEPWGDPYQREEPHGYMGDCAIVPLDDYDHARRCVNALAGMNPEAVAELVEAASVVEAVMRLGEFPSPENRAALGAAFAALGVER
jgi:hypothetical protein